MLFFCISDRRSRGEERREENKIEGPGSSVGVDAGAVDMGGVEEEVADVGGLLAIKGVEDSNNEA